MPAPPPGGAAARGEDALRAAGHVAPAGRRPGGRCAVGRLLPRAGRRAGLAMRRGPGLAVCSLRSALVGFCVPVL